VRVRHKNDRIEDLCSCSGREDDGRSWRTRSMPRGPGNASGKIRQISAQTGDNEASKLEVIRRPRS
jgi:hypothetical protein